MTYNVSGGMLNLAQFNATVAHSCKLSVINSVGYSGGEG